MKELLSVVQVDDTSIRLSDSQVEELVSHVSDWEIVEEDGEKHLRRRFEFRDFAGAMAFADHIAEQAEIENHHPRMVIQWGEVTIDWWTHKVGGLHMNDFVMAVRTDDVYSRWDLIGGDKDAIDVASEESFPASDSPSWQ